MAITMDEAVVELGEAFDVKIAEALAVTDVTEDEKIRLAARYKQVFRDNIRQGLANVFGPNIPETAGAAGDLIPSIEVTPEDLEEQDEVLDHLVSRRKRYPAVAAKLLATTLQKNRSMLQGLKVNAELPVVDLSDVTVSPSLDTVASMETVSREVKQARTQVVEAGNKAGQLVSACKILAGTEGALDLISSADTSS